VKGVRIVCTTKAALFGGRYCDTGATFGFAIGLILADVTTAFRLWMKAKPVGGLSEIGKDPPQIRPIREPVVATVSGEWAAMVTQCDRVELF
jgi:hypothetical protein